VIIAGAPANFEPPAITNITARITCVSHSAMRDARPRGGLVSFCVMVPSHCIGLANVATDVVVGQPRFFERTGDCGQSLCGVPAGATR